METQAGKRFYDLKDAEKELKIGRRTLREYIKRGELKARKIGRAYLVTEQALIAFVEAGK